MKPFPKVEIPIVNMIDYHLIRTTNRLTFDIIWQHPQTRWETPTEDADDWYLFVASNGYEVISQSRMDIQTRRLWLTGYKANERSGTMVFSNNTQRDIAYHNFLLALKEWQAFVKGEE